jgi:hypothetical protein
MYEDAVRIIADFRKLVRDVNTAISHYDDEVNHCDMAMGDIRHFFELNKVSAKKRKDISRLGNEYSTRRRIASDNLLVLRPFGEWVTNNRKTLAPMDNMYGDMLRQHSYVSNPRAYKPRVLTELFEDAEPL